MNATQYPGLIPSHEHERLAALQPYQVLGTPGQELFNDFVGVVAKLLDAPIALVSLVRADDVVFIGNAGMSESGVVSREDSMCSVAILADDLTEFCDLLAEPCTLVNPFIAQQLRLGFYAGQALRTPEGQAIGSLCVLDYKPRRLSPTEGELLKELALVAQELLRLQAAEAAGATLEPTVRARLDGPTQQSLTRLATLAALRQWDTDTDSDEAHRYAATRLDEARYLAQTLHRQLQAVRG